MGKKSKKCRKCCCQPLCLISWAVFGIGLTFSLVFMFLDCQIYHAVTIEQNDVLIYWLTQIALFFPTGCALLFIFLTKCQLACVCCKLIKILWFLSHIGLCAIAALMNYFAHFHTVTEYQHVLANSTLKSKKKLPKWFAEVQHRNSCCGIQNYTDYNNKCLPSSLISSCGNNTDIGCKPYLDHVYWTCRKTSIAYILVMICLGVIPYVIYSLSYRNKIGDEQVSPSPPKKKKKQKGQVKGDPSKKTVVEDEPTPTTPSQVDNRNRNLKIDLQPSDEDEVNVNSVV